MSPFFRFPRTPHLAWLGAAAPRDDKVLSPADVQELLRDEVVVEEKLDGANVGVSLDSHGRLQAQNRGNHLVRLHAPPQFKPLFRWLDERRADLVPGLSPELILFGEWCYAIHSVRYDALPDWFLGFDVYDRGPARFWSVARRNTLLERLGVKVVPTLATGRFDLPALRGLLGPSRFGDGNAEGLYVRRDDGPFLAMRAKLVRPEFVQDITGHWSDRALEPNRLASSSGR